LLHGWSPNLAARYFNMNINNSNKVFCFLYKKYHPGQVVMSIKEAVHDLTHSFLQRGDPMRWRGYDASPSATKDITTSSSNEGKQVRIDSVRQPFLYLNHLQMGLEPSMSVFLSLLTTVVPVVDIINNAHLVEEDYNNHGEFISQYQC
jgi:hypothetical protein